jgi:hypothetical protein
MKELIDYIVKEWLVIRSAPVTFIMTLVLAAIVAILAAGSRYEGVVQTLKERVEGLKESIATKDALMKESIATKDALIGEYRQRLHLAPTDESRYSVMSNDELRDTVLKVSGGLRAYAEELDMKHTKLLDSYTARMRGAATEEDRSRIWHEESARLFKFSSDMNATYDKKYKISASLLHDELVRRLPESYSSKNYAHAYESPTNMIGIREVADDLEKLARSLR